MSGCGTGSCGCSSTENSAAATASTLTPTQTAAYEALAATMADAPQQAAPAPQAGATGGMGSVVAEVARVNGVALNASNELLDEETLRQRACT